MPLEFNKVLANVAQNEADLGAQLLNYGSTSDLIDSINSFITFFFNVSVVLIITFLVVAGVKFLTSAGDKTKAEEAKKALQYSIIALILLAGFTLFIRTILPALLVGSKTERVNLPRITL